MSQPQGQMTTPGAYAYGSYAPMPGAQYTATPAPGTSGWSYSYGYFGSQAGSSSNPAASTPGNRSIAAPATAPTPAASTHYNRETTASVPAARGRGKASTKGIFTKELRNLMYGFGDDRNPANDTVNMMEEILIEYISDVCMAATGGRKTRLAVDDLRRVLAHPADAKKLARMEELLFMQEDIKRARAQVDENEIARGRFDDF